MCGNFDLENLRDLIFVTSVLKWKSVGHGIMIKKHNRSMRINHFNKSFFISKHIFPAFTQSQYFIPHIFITNLKLVIINQSVGQFHNFIIHSVLKFQGCGAVWVMHTQFLEQTDAHALLFSFLRLYNRLKLFVVANHDDLLTPRKRLDAYRLQRLRCLIKDHEIKHFWDVMNVDRSQCHEPQLFGLKIPLVLLDWGKFLASWVQFFKLFINAVSAALPDNFVNGYFSWVKSSFKNVIQRSVGKSCDQHRFVERVTLLNELHNKFSLACAWHTFNERTVFRSEYLFKGFLLVWV